MSTEQQHLVDPVGPPPAEAPPTGPSEAEHAPAGPSGRVLPTLAQRSAGGKKGGNRARHVALIGLGAPLPVISLKSSADRMAVLEAVLSAVAEGRTSGMVAQTGPSEAEHAPAGPSGRVLPTLAQRSAGGKKGGNRARHVALIGLGAPLPVISLKSSADRMAVLEAVLSAVAEGRTSGMVAQTIIALVRAANELARHDQEDALAELEARLDQVLASRVVR